MIWTGLLTFSTSTTRTHGNRQSTCGRYEREIQLWWKSWTAVDQKPTLEARFDEGKVTIVDTRPASRKSAPRTYRSGRKGVYPL